MLSAVAEPRFSIRAGLLAFSGNYPVLVAAQTLSGVTGAIIGMLTILVITILVITDLTAGTGRFNLAVGTVGALSGVAASASTGATGFVFQALGPRLGHLPLAAVAAAASGLLWMLLAETKPAQYESNTRVKCAGVAGGRLREPSALRAPQCCAT